MSPQTYKRAGIALIVAGGLLSGLLGELEGNPGAPASVLLMIAGIFVYYRGRQKAAKAAAEGPSSPLRDSKADVLYLRAFQADTATTYKILTAGMTTEEEQLADVLRPFGDLVAIGRPGEQLPVPGALRMYTSDSEWKDVVLDRMRSAPLVVIRASAGAGLFWEIEQARSTLRPEKLLLLVLHLSPREYATFADHVRDNFQLNLPAIARCGLLRGLIDIQTLKPLRVLPGFVMFADDWSPVFLPIPFSLVRMGYNDLRKSLNLALRPVFERHGVAWRPLGRFR